MSSADDLFVELTQELAERIKEIRRKYNVNLPEGVSLPYCKDNIRKLLGGKQP